MASRSASLDYRDTFTASSKKLLDREKLSAHNRIMPRTAEVYVNLERLVEVASRVVRDPAPRKEAPDTSRVEEMLALRRAGESLQAIGERYNITRERVRQLLKPWGAKELRGITEEQKRRAEQEEAEKRRAYLARTMKKWLWDAGYRRCAKCKLWDSYVTVTMRRCRKCNTAHVLDRYHDPSTGYRDYLIEYHRTHPEVNRRAQRKYYSTPKGKEKMRSSSRKQWETTKARMATDPEFAKKERAAQNRRKQKYIQRHMADPAWAAKYRAKQAEKQRRIYARKKALQSGIVND